MSVSPATVTGAGPGQQIRREHHERAGYFHHQQILVRSPHVLALSEFVADQGIRGERHQLPEEAEEDHEVSRGHDAVHAGDEQQKVGIVAGDAVVLVMRHVADGIERGEDRDRGNQPEKYRAQAVHRDPQR